MPADGRTWRGAEDKTKPKTGESMGAGSWAVDSEMRSSLSGESPGTEPGG